MNKKISYILLPIATIILIIQIFLNDIDSDFRLFLILLTLILCGISIKPLWNYVKRDEPEGSLKEQKPVVFVSVSTALYGIIAGFAITHAVSFPFLDFTSSFEGFPLPISLETITAIHSELATLENKFLITGIFLATAIPFYHGAMVYLTKKQLFVSNISIKDQIIHFGGLFTQAIIFLGIALVLENISIIIAFFTLLLFVDSIWILIGQRTSHPPPLGWLCLNIGFFASINIISHPFFEDSGLWFLLYFAIARTTIDYFGFKKVFFG